MSTYLPIALAISSIANIQNNTQVILKSTMPHSSSFLSTPFDTRCIRWESASPVEKNFWALGKSSQVSILMLQGMSLATSTALILSGPRAFRMTKLGDPENGNFLFC